MFGPPDLSNLDPLGDATDTDTDTGTLIDSALPTDTGPDPLAPSIASFSLLPEVEALTIRFSVSDSDLDLVGGFVTLTSLGGEQLTLQIPGEIAVWDALGTSVISVPTPFMDCRVGYEGSWSMSVTDAAGRVSETVSADVAIEPRGLLPETVDPHLLGVIGVPTIACVAFDPDPESHDPIDWQLQADSEFMRFGVAREGMYHVQMAWPTSMQLGLWMFADGYGSIGNYGYEQGANSRDVWGELVQGQLYQLNPSFWSLNDAEPPYEATILIQQE